jgi:hypothetical protein
LHDSMVDECKNTYFMSVKRLKQRNGFCSYLTFLADIVKT